MSLINNMLKDLEARKTVYESDPAITLLPMQQKKAFFLQQKHLNIGLVIFIALALCIYLVKKQLHHNAALLPPQYTLTQISTNPKMEIVDNSLWLKPASITGVILQLKDNITEITFLLNHPTLYRIITNDVQNQFSIIFDHAEIQAALPPTHDLNTVVQNIATRSINGDTRFDLALLPGASVKYVNLNEDEKNPELVIGIAYAALTNVPSPQNGTTHVLIKKTAIETQLTQQYQTALSYAENGYYQSAIDTLFALLKMNPSYKDARMSLAALLLDQGKRTDANKLIDAGLANTPDYIPYIELKARLLTAAGKIKPALALLQTASPPLNENADYHAFMAALYQRNNEDILAAKLYRQLLAYSPSNGNWWLGLGLSLEKLNQTSEAINAYTKALAVGRLNSATALYLHKRLEKLQESSNAAE